MNELEAVFFRRTGYKKYWKSKASEVLVSESQYEEQLAKFLKEKSVTKCPDGEAKGNKILFRNKHTSVFGRKRGALGSYKR